MWDILGRGRRDVYHVLVCGRDFDLVTKNDILRCKPKIVETIIRTGGDSNSKPTAISVLAFWAANQVVYWLSVSPGR